MGDVLITYKLMPESPEVPLQGIKDSVGQKISGLCTRFSIEEHPIAFGLVALHVKVVMPDKTGDPERVEAELNAIEKVESVESIGVGLL
ncbi:MAG: elongation factor 1-beta [Candidatus Thermoplasmatota archaeon]|nr:elongation factor 1-beta [Candidatus Thermoplasmatota archaeon]